MSNGVAFELACESVPIAPANRLAATRNRPTGASVPQVRRSPAVVLLRSAHDIRPLFENASDAEPPIARDMPLAIVAQASAAPPRIFELAPEIFDLLGSLDEWVDQVIFDECEDAGQLISDLATAGLVEIRR